MLGNIWFIALFWTGLALLASLLSIRLGGSVALVEVVVGFDLIAIGHSGHPERWGRLPGDPADRSRDHAPCSVLIVKE